MSVRLFVMRALRDKSSGTMTRDNTTLQQGPEGAQLKLRLVSLHSCGASIRESWRKSKATADTLHFWDKFMKNGPKDRG